jgi:PAT family acetyl-CoA transporter-like MFS transporter 1
MAFAAGDGLTGLKLIEAGVPKDKLALLAIPLTPLQIALPWILGRRTSGPRPMDVCQKAYPYK